VLGKPVRYTIYLPYDYSTSERYYPVVYLLHGYMDNESSWIQFGEANLIADEAIASRAIPPMILATPAEGLSLSSYINNYNDSVRYEDFFMKEFIPYVESKYRVRPGKQFRGVAGLSSGGFGALTYALRHPGMFNACAALSAPIPTDEDTINRTEEQWSEVWGV